MRRETILALIRKEEEQREIRLKAEWTTRHTNSTELNWFNIPFEKIQRAAALKPGEIDGTIRGINNFENVCLTGEFLRVAPKTYHHQVGGSEYSTGRYFRIWRCRRCNFEVDYLTLTRSPIQTFESVI